MSDPGRENPHRCNIIQSSNRPPLHAMPDIAGNI
jgi:hypothetical protein